MARRYKITISLGQPKAPTFGEALRSAIREAFGTNRVFALKLGVSEGRVSQLLNGTESITAQTLDELLPCFTDIGTQTRLHQAWVDTFAPSPFHRLQGLEAEHRAHQLLANSASLVSTGNARWVLSEARSLLSPQLPLETYFQLNRLAIDIALFLQLPSLAIQLANGLIERGKEKSEPAQIATALYTLANASRTIRGMRPEELIRIHSDAVSFLASWTPAGTSPIRDELSRALRRDRVLTLLAISEHQPLDPETLRTEQRALNRILLNLSDEKDLALAREVNARLLVAEGQVFEAEEVLEKVTGVKLSISADYPSKAKITAGRILLRRMETEGAIALLDSALEDCLKVDDLHHAQVIEGLTYKTLSAQPQS